MHREFKLKYGKLDKANIKYRDATFNEKRLWVSRLLIQFLLEKVIIISVDESNFRSDSLPSKQWQFNPKHKRKRSKMIQKRKARMLKADEEDLLEA